MATYRSRTGARSQTARHGNGAARLVIGAVILAVIAVAFAPQVARWFG